VGQPRVEQVWRHRTRLHKEVTVPDFSTTECGEVVPEPLGQQLRTHGVHSVPDTSHGGRACNGDVEFKKTCHTVVNDGLEETN
jgi:hypothetical protein